jgi:hypothetical protein
MCCDVFILPPFLFPLCTYDDNDADDDYDDLTTSQINDSETENNFSLP